MRAFVNLVLSRDCAGCSAPDVALCLACQQNLDRALPSLCMPQPEPCGMPSTWAAAPYAGVLRSVIVAWKDADRLDLAPALAPLLARAMAQALVDSPSVTAAIKGGQPLVIVPMPSRASSMRSRGRWPLAEVVTAVQNRTGQIPGLMSVPALHIKNGGRDQAGLNQWDRARNVRHAMAVDPRHAAALHGAVCLLVDDIVTTGNTLSEGARALQSSGARTVLAATVAATTRRGAASPTRG